MSWMVANHRSNYASSPITSKQDGSLEASLMVFGIIYSPSCFPHHISKNPGVYGKFFSCGVLEGTLHSFQNCTKALSTVW